MISLIIIWFIDSHFNEPVNVPEKYKSTDVLIKIKSPAKINGWSPSPLKASVKGNNCKNKSVLHERN